MGKIDFVEEYIVGRRSIRSYLPQPVEQEKIEKLVRACFYAPSAMNRDPRSLIIVDEREKLDRLMEIHPYASFLKQAPMAMIVCAHPHKTSMDFFIDDCAASTENILIAAKALGLGSCWCGVYHTERAEPIGELFGLPEGVVPYSLIVLGYPESEGKMPPRDLVGTVHRNRW